ncbi:DUF4129 domain-containing protein [Halorussus salinus]|uniref:DUF4129 domain-containing protein n=1 Tax=Halorussus salinus TaxID=1364935 RepID=UPI001091EB48|nr:DUF4129 domain-containing protein [Halorussus salinus]
MRGVDGERLRSVAVALLLLAAAASGASAAGASTPSASASETGTQSFETNKYLPGTEEYDFSISRPVSKAGTPAVGARGSAVGAQETTTPGGNDTANATVRHRNPGRVGEGSNASDVGSWLQDRMVERLVRSVEVSERDADRARRIVGNDSQFEEFADKYAELKGESSGGDRNLSDLDGVGAIQSAFLADVNDYRTTLQRYQRVRENGTTDRERRLAHALERRLSAVNRSAAALRESYANVSSRGAASSAERNATTNASRQIEAVREDVLTTQRTVRDQTLVRTDLSVEARSANRSFTDRVTLRGRLVTAATGTAVGPRNVSLRIENRTVRTATNATGHFEVGYRPTLASVGDRTRTVQFRPANSSRYLRDNATVRFGVERVEPAVELRDYAESVGFGDSLTVAGTVAAENVSTGDVAVVATLAGVPMGRTTTAPNGSFDLRTAVPANVSTGERRLRVRLADSRFSAANATAAVTVEPTPTDLSMTELRRVNGSLFVSGRLTARGAPLPNRTVQLAVGGTAVGTVTTNATGGYAEVVSVPSSVSDRPNATVNASYAPVGENLQSSRADATVAFEETGGNGLDYPLALRVAGLLGLAVIGVVLARRLGGDDWSLGDDETPAPASAASDLSATVPGDADRSADALLDAAAERLDGDAAASDPTTDPADEAALLAYAAARKRLDGAVGRSSAETHWEFYADCRDGGLSAERADDLKRLTETYERAAFAPEPVSESDAARAVATASDLEPARPGRPS